MKIILRTLLLVIIVLLANVAALADDRETLRQYIVQLQSKPDDADLHGKIIRLVAAMTPKPEIPEEARRHFVRAITLQKEAKQPSDYDEVIKEYEAAGLLAPWWPEVFFNHAIACESRSQYAKAIACLRLYLMTKPGEADARAAQDRIYALEARQEKAAKDVATVQVGKEAEFLKSLDGARFISTYERRIAGEKTVLEKGQFRIEIHGAKATRSVMTTYANPSFNRSPVTTGVWEPVDEGAIEGRQVVLRDRNSRVILRMQIAGDGTKITDGSDTYTRQ